MSGRAFHPHLSHFPPIQRHNTSIILHVTVCASARGQHVFDNPAAHRALTGAWRRATHWLIGEYVLMPDHIHLFCAPGVTEWPPVRRWAGYWKRLMGMSESRFKGAFQDDCWDTQMRSRANYEEKLAYIQNNPVRKQLATDWQAWPYRGRLFDVSWWGD